MVSPSFPTSPNLPGTLALLSPCTPPSLSRAWLSAPHPYLPWIATCSSDKSVRVYSLSSFTLLSTISGGHKRSVRSCAWKPGAKGESVLATGSFDASVGVWKHWDSDAGGFNPKPETDFTSTENAEEDEEWRFALVLDGHEHEVKSVAWSAGGNFLATCSRDKTVWIWEEVGEDDFETIAVLQEHSQDVKCVAWHPEEELLASGSYDDDIRLWKEEVDDWGCVAVLRGHDSTVWGVGWEGAIMRVGGEDVETEAADDKRVWVERRLASGPRLISCSDDMSIRVWRKVPRKKGPAQNPLSIIRSGSSEEVWVEEARLPQRHERAILAVAWSSVTGRVVSTGGDGRVVVYEERWRGGPPPGEKLQGDSAIKKGHNDGQASATPKNIVNGAKENGDGSENSTEIDHTMKDGTTPTNVAEDAAHSSREATDWMVIAELEGAHGVFEVNHVCWAPRADRDKKPDEEVIISTGDDGVVKVWSLEV